MNVMMRALGAPVLLFAVLTTTLAGCGQDTSPGEEVPALAAALDQVDAAVEAENYDKARSAVEFLLAETRRARQDDDLSADDADRIRSAARAVMANLPDAEDSPEPTEDPTPESDATPTEDEPDDKDRGKPDKDDDKPGKGKGSDD